MDKREKRLGTVGFPVEAPCNSTTPPGCARDSPYTYGLCIAPQRAWRVLVNGWVYPRLNEWLAGPDIDHQHNEAGKRMRRAGKRLQAEEWLQWHRTNWGGAEIPTDPPAAIKTGAANWLTKIAVQQWLERPFEGLWGVLVAADSLEQQWAVQKRLADRTAWRKHFAAKAPPEKTEWPKGANIRNHTYWKWMEFRANEHKMLAEMEVQASQRQRAEWIKKAMEVADTHPWAHRDDIRSAWRIQDNWRGASVWRSIVYACWRDTRPGVAAWPVWMQPQTGGEKGKARELPSVDEPCDGMHPQGRNRRLRQVFEGLKSRAEQVKAVEVMTVATGSAPDWMIPREVDPPKRPGRPRKAT